MEQLLTLSAEIITQRESSNINFFIIGTKYFLRKFRLHKIDIIGMIWAQTFRIFHNESSHSLTKCGSMLVSSTSPPNTSHITGNTVAHCFRTFDTSLCVISINLSKNVSCVISMPIIGATLAIICDEHCGIKEERKENKKKEAKLMKWNLYEFFFLLLFWAIAKI